MKKIISALFIVLVILIPPKLLLAANITSNSRIYGRTLQGADTQIVTDPNGMLRSAPLPASTAIIGTVGIDQTTPGTTNGVDVIRMVKGTVTVAHNAISGTATSSAIDTRGWNAVNVHVIVTGSGSWTISTTGCPTSGGTYAAEEVDLIMVARAAVTSNISFILPTISNYTKIVATEDSGTASVTVTVTPVNMGGI